MTKRNSDLTVEQALKLGRVSDRFKYLAAECLAISKCRVYTDDFRPALDRAIFEMEEFDKLPGPSKPFDFDETCDFHGHEYARILKGCAVYGDIFLGPRGVPEPCAGYIGVDIPSTNRTYGAHFYRLQSVAKQQAEDDA